VTCADGPHTTSGDATFAVKLRAAFRIFGENSTGAKVAVRGTAGRATAAGTIQLTGNLPIDGAGTGQGCDSGVLNWTAARA
jgi:hypothetical protein